MGGGGGGGGVVANIKLCWHQRLTAKWSPHSDLHLVLEIMRCGFAVMH